MTTRQHQVGACGGGEPWLGYHEWTRKSELQCGRERGLGCRSPGIYMSSLQAQRRKSGCRRVRPARGRGCEAKCSQENQPLPGELRGTQRGQPERTWAFFNGESGAGPSNCSGRCTLCTPAPGSLPATSFPILRFSWSYFSLMLHETQYFRPNADSWLFLLSCPSAACNPCAGTRLHGRAVSFPWERVT